MAINRYLSALVLGFGLFGLVASVSAQGNSGMGGAGGMGGGNTGTTFSVEVIPIPGEPQPIPGVPPIYWVDTTVGGDDGCVPGTTEGEKDLNAFWPDLPEDCLTPDVMAGGAPLWLFAIGVRGNKSDVTLFFTDVSIVYPSPVSNESVYVSDRLSWDLVGDLGGSFQLKVDPPDVVLTKAHEPAKGTTLDPIAVGNIVYTPNP